MAHPDFSELLEAIRALPESERQRLVAAILSETEASNQPEAQLKREIGERDRIERVLLETQRQVAEANHLFQLVLDTIPARVFWKDTKLRYLGGNLRFAQDAGLDRPEALVGKTDGDLCWPGQAEHFRKDDLEVLEKLEPKIDYEEPQTGEDGTTRWLRTSKFPLRSADGEVVGILGTYQDITERRRLQNQLRQAQKLEAVGQLAGGVAHDFNNLLTGIVGNAELLSQAHASDEDLAACARDILHASRRAADLTQQLLAFSRKGRLRTTDVNLHQLAHQTTKLLLHGEGSPIDIETDFQASPPIVHGDPTQLGSALLNLAMNARDAMPNGGVLRLATRSRFYDAATCKQRHHPLPPGRYIELTISDTGVGIPAAIQHRIFEPFFTTKKTGDGTGLGLAAVFGSVQSHGGCISVTSKPGAGSTFTVLLPCAQTKVRSPTPAEFRIPEQGKGHILVVDDEEVVRNLTARALRKYGYDVTTCADGLEAVAFFQAHYRDIDLVVLDLVMPRQDGATTLRQLLTIDPDVRVLLASGFSRERAADTLLELGAKGFLAKPFRLDQLAREVAVHKRPSPP